MCARLGFEAFFAQNFTGITCLKASLGKFNFILWCQDRKIEKKIKLFPRTFLKLNFTITIHNFKVTCKKSALYDNF